MDLGCDIVEIARVRELARRQPRFLTRVFSPDEIAYCRTKKLQWQHFAVRFAAKEAIWKALGRSGLTLRDITVWRDERGRPGAMVKGRKMRSLKVSLSHSERYALAVAAKR